MAVPSTWLAPKKCLFSHDASVAQKIAWLNEGAEEVEIIDLNTEDGMSSDIAQFLNASAQSAMTAMHRFGGLSLFGSHPPQESNELGEGEVSGATP